MGAATFLASPWGAGSDAAKEGQAGVCMLPLPHTHTPTHTPGEHGDLGSPLAAAPHWCGLGLPAARAATRKKGKR